MSTQKLFNIESARSTEDIKVTKDLFETYAISLGFDLAFQNFDAEMLDFPGKYSPPKGELFLARDIKGVPIGCVGLRPLTPEGCCEMKRLYILPAGRGLGIGKALVKAVVDVAIRLGYTEMKLDTLPSMHTDGRDNFLGIPTSKLIKLNSSARTSIEAERYPFQTSHHHAKQRLHHLYRNTGGDQSSESGISFNSQYQTAEETKMSRMIQQIPERSDDI